MPEVAFVTKMIEADICFYDVQCVAAAHRVDGRMHRFMNGAAKPDTRIASE